MYMSKIGENQQGQLNFSDKNNYFSIFKFTVLRPSV